MDWVTSWLMLSGVFLYAWIGGLIFGCVILGMVKEGGEVKVPLLGWLGVALTTIVWPVDLLMAWLFIRRGKKLVNERIEEEKEKKAEFQADLDRTAEEYGGVSPSQVPEKMREFNEMMAGKKGDMH